jgi:AcrR family transcriptional regulator
MPARRRKSAPSKSAASGDPKQRLIDAAFELAAEGGWRRLGMAEIAAAAGVSLREAHTHFRTKFAILIAFRRGIDDAVLAGPAPSANDSPRDRLFEVLMRRLDALKPYRRALRVILRDSIGEPVLGRSLVGFLRSMSWMLAAADLPTGGCQGRLTVKLVAGLYLSVLPVFFRDESEDLGTTMAALDRRLRQAESLASALRPITNRARKARE